MEGCIFCQIASGEMKTNLIYDDELIAAFPDNHPIRPGHAMIISRQHWRYFEDLPEDTSCRIIHVAQRLAAAMKKLYGVPRVAFAFTGGDHDHAHAHVIPMREKTDLTSRRYIMETDLTFRSTPEASSDELAKTAEELRNALI
ncbi:MAG: HIT family protein [Geminicoccales bacterium]